MSDISALTSAAVGLLGVATGLTGDLMRRHWQRPKLQVLEYSSDTADGVHFNVFPEQAEAAYLRLRVQNLGRETARSVEAVIENVAPLATEDGRDLRRSAFAPQNPAALVGRRLKWADRDEPFIDIPPGAIRRVDIAHVTTVEPYHDDDGLLAVPIRMTLNKESRIDRQLLAGTHYRVAISLVGENCGAVAYSFNMVFGGRWLGNSTLTGDSDRFAIVGVERVALSAR